jgi:hypothetical protein
MCDILRYCEISESMIGLMYNLIEKGLIL